MHACRMIYTYFIIFDIMKSLIIPPPNEVGDKVSGM